MTDYVRTQVLLEKKQRQQLDEIAEKSGISFSELVAQFFRFTSFEFAPTKQCGKPHNSF